MFTDHMLIDIVRDHEELYNRDHPDYLNQVLRDIVWRKIAEKLGENSTTCKEKWHRIRDNFRKAIQLRAKKMETGTKIRPPKYHQQLSFLIPHVSEDSSIGIDASADDGNDDNDEEQSDSSLSNPPRKAIKRSHSEIANEEIMVFDNTQLPQTDTGTDHVLTDFFVNMANTVAKLPVIKQIEIKGKLFKMVHDAEMELATGGSCPFS